MNQPQRTADQGLTSAEAAARLKADGPNELTPPKPRTPWHIAGEVAREPMFQLLLAAGLLYLFLGDLGEALMLLAFVAMTVTITVVQEQRTEKALQALRDLTSPQARVLRDGQTVTIPSRELVVGDLLVLTEGGRVAADAWVWTASDLQADESLLTGEAVPVSKAAADSQVFGGTMLVSGGGMAQVTATGTRSEIGRAGHHCHAAHTFAYANAQTGAHLFSTGLGFESCGGGFVWVHAWRLDGGPVGGYYPGDVNAAAGVPAHIDRVHGHGGVATVAPAGVGTPRIHH